MEGLGVTCVFGMGLLLFLVWTLGVFSIQPKRFYRIWLGIPVLGLVALWAILSYHGRASVVFRDSVGFDPPPDVTIENSLRHMPIDWDDSYLKFCASDSTISRILRKGFIPIKPDDIIEYGTAPEWWTPPKGPGISIYATNTDNPKFSNKDFRFFLSHRLLIYALNSGDSGKRLVYLRYRRP